MQKYKFKSSELSQLTG